MASLSVPELDQIEAIYGLEGEPATRMDFNRFYVGAIVDCSGF
jgi:hypothetical protein